MRPSITLAGVTGVLGVLTACGSEYELAHTPGPEAAPVGEAERDAPAQIDRFAAPDDEAPPELSPPERWAQLPSPGGATVQLRQLQGEPVFEETFQFGGGASTLTDVLFVVDGSVSMGPLVDKVRAGMDALTEEGVFPSGTRIAVTNMTPQNVRGNAPLQYVWKKRVAAAEPGFARLVSEESLAAAREQLSDDERYAHQFDLPGCDAWFAPGELASDGTPCLVSHTQILEAPTGVEAGLLSFGQLALRDKELFRPGAAVNVVFVSDTHGPGLPPDHRDYEALRSVYVPPEDVAGLVRAGQRSPVASLRFHAVAPTEGCTSEEFEAPLYHEAAEATGGGWLDICTATASDYVELMRDIAVEGSRPQQAILPLAAKPEAVDSVFVDGAPVRFALRGRALVLDTELSPTSSEVQVRYRTRAEPTFDRTRSR